MSKQSLAENFNPLNISLVVAMSINGVIGSDNQLPWHLADDLKFFKALTTGHTVLMGRKTFDSIGKALPNRQNLVLTRQPDLTLPGAICCANLPEAIQIARRAQETDLFVIGGAEIYRLALPFVHTFYMTRVWVEIPDSEGLVSFPPYNTEEWQETKRLNFSANAQNDYAFDIFTFQRKTKPIEWMEN